MTMTNEELARLISHHEMWLHAGDIGGKRLQLTSRHLSEHDFHQRILKFARFIGSNLDGCNFNQSDLTGTDFQESSLRFATFREANAIEAQFKDSTIFSADFRWASLKNANFSGATLLKVDFRGANLRGANLNDADIYGCRFTNANLKGTILEEQQPKLNQIYRSTNRPIVYVVYGGKIRAYEHHADAGYLERLEDIGELDKSEVFGLHRGELVLK